MKKIALIILIALICIFNMPNNVKAADESVSLTETVTATQTDTAVVIQQFTYCWWELKLQNLYFLL